MLLDGRLQEKCAQYRGGAWLREIPRAQSLRSLARHTHTHRCAIIAAAAERSHARARVHASEQPPMHACVDYGVLITRIVCSA